ncbi:N-methyl-L-tryptophan oxidase [Bythopirellula goksoeyrii]|uniref:Monomeric sarcosine oxidase n=1 Tax=Bythopirellula goksoeyrii TaxID=1400387 RepID=A0A5B9QJ06_9BACT|nr:N-methyl-L-tryptophan oxidase [Bythopirellula goksoeyrii]QEG34093.1 Monomeric sarcosine oxidase [Bythopirellula goksoeyrii]
MADFEVVVLGLGGIGSATLLHLARRGKRVLGIDRFIPPHSHGSSHGHTRIIRQAYFEHPQYVPLLAESYRLWRDLEKLTGEKLYHEIGVLQVGPESGVVVPGVRRAAQQHNLAVEELSPQIMRSRWPALSFPDSMAGVLEAHAGYLLVEECVRSQLAAAKDAGAEVQAPCEVLRWEGGNSIRIHTATGMITAERLVIAAGPWASTLLGDLYLQLQVRRKSVFWFAGASHFSAQAGYPCFLYELPSGVFYGFPLIGSQGIKLAKHSGGQRVENPLQVNKSIDAEDEKNIDGFRSLYLPDVTNQLLEHQTCFYTMSPDDHFIVDRHPQANNVVFAAGMSGHGFKFSPVLGQALADLSLDGGTDLPIDFLSLERLSTL